MKVGQQLRVLKNGPIGITRLPLFKAMQRRIGDRFRYSSAFGWFIWEIIGYTSFEGVFDVKLVEHQDGGGGGELLGHYRIGNSDEYLGNFAKSHNFNSLYDKLCGK